MSPRGGPHQVLRLYLCLKLFAALAVAADETSLNSGFENDLHLDDGILTEKRYLAAMAKNGRLPKFNSHKRDESSETSLDDDDPKDDAWVDEKRHVGAFLKTHGKPNFGGMVEGRRSASFDNSRYQSSMESEVEKTGKRNVASLARLGRLNAVRFGRFQPQYYGGEKRENLYYGEMNDGRQTDNEVTTTDDDECENETPQDFGKSPNTEDNYLYPYWFQSQQKRYVAALARSGRLPVWHSQRMWWGGKRDLPNAYWLRYRSGARTGGDKRKNGKTDSRFVKTTSQRCKKSTAAEVFTKNGTEAKRNLSVLARKGMIPVRP